MGLGFLYITISCHPCKSYKPPESLPRVQLLCLTTDGYVGWCSHQQRLDVATGLTEWWCGSALGLTARASLSYKMCPVLLAKLSSFSGRLCRTSWCLQPWDLQCSLKAQKSSDRWSDFSSCVGIFFLFKKKLNQSKCIRCLFFRKMLLSTHFWVSQAYSHATSLADRGHHNGSMCSWTVGRTVTWGFIFM